MNLRKPDKNPDLQHINGNSAIILIILSITKIEILDRKTQFLNEKLIVRGQILAPPIKTSCQNIINQQFKHINIKVT